MADSSTRTTRLSGEMDERYEEYRDEKDMTDAEALRTLIRSGLESETDDSREYTAVEDGLLSAASNLATAALIIGLAAVVGLLTPTAATVLIVVSLLAAGVCGAIVRLRVFDGSGNGSSTQTAEEVTG